MRSAIIALLLLSVTATQLRYDEDDESRYAQQDGDEGEDDHEQEDGQAQEQEESHVSDSNVDYAANAFSHGMAAGAGFIQTASSACLSHKVDGITCLGDDQLFASGMNGDEDLGVDIKMKGEPYHFMQGAGSSLAVTEWNPVVVKQDYKTLPCCNGVNGPHGANCKNCECSGTNGVKDGPAGGSCHRSEPKSIPHYNRDPKAGRPYETTGDLTRNSFSQVNQKKLEAALLALEDSEAEKVSVLQTPIALGHTTFYAQLEDSEAEKVSVLQTPIAVGHTTFY